MASGLDELTAYIRDIPEVIESYSSGRGGQSTVYAALEPLRARVNRVKYYDDEWDTREDGRLAHYTSWKTALEILTPDSPVMRMYNYETSNDPLEGKIVPSEWNEARRDATWLDEYNGASSTAAYGCSFSSGKDIDDDLTLWRLYGNDGEGCSLAMVEAERRMFRVRYRRQDGAGREKEDVDNDQRVADQMRVLFDAGGQAIMRIGGRYKDDVGQQIADAVRQVFEGYCHLVKDVAYSREGEWRRIEVNPDPQSVRFDVAGARIRRYVEGPTIEKLLSSGSSITVGPTVYNKHAACAYLEKLALDRGIRYTAFKASDKPYR